jgi:hypothetical protein
VGLWDVLIATHVTAVCRWRQSWHYSHSQRCEEEATQTQYDGVACNCDL